MPLTELQLDTVFHAQENRLTSRRGLDIDLSYHRNQVKRLLSLSVLTYEQRQQLTFHRRRIEALKTKISAWGFNR